MRKLAMAAAVLFGIVGMAQESNSVLYKISGNGLKAPSYLFGTMHMTCDATIDAATRKALEETKQLYLELDMDDPAMQTAMMGGMMMKDGKTISSMVSEADFKQLDKVMTEKVGMSAMMLNMMKPFMLSAMLIPSLLDCPMQSFEGELMKITHEQGEQVFGLETVESQMAVFDAIPYQVQVDELMKGVRDGFVNDKKELARMMEVYKTKNLDAMMKLMSESDNKLNSGFSEELLFKRNRNWIPVIEQTAKATPTFFGVGAAHLGGDQGVIKLLRQKGYKVEAVK
ncbi:MAG: TraB/GumN family protein [Flavobacterium sp.]|nr:TraB/GumN family protein [Flavobacterium sp.]